MIYTLERVSSDGEITINRLTGVEKFKSLRDAKEMNLFFPESRQLDYLVEIVKDILLFRVTVPWDLKRLEEVYSSIISHHKEVMQ